MIANKDLKRRIVEISYRLGLGHLGSCITSVDIVEEIYRTKNPGEKFIMSNGHAHLAHLVVWEKWAQDNKLVLVDPKKKPHITDSEELIKKYGIHCDRKAGCDVSTGSLGHGIGIAVGMALADRSKNVYCLLSDGECAEGSVYEALRIWQELELWNLKIYINDNHYGAYKKTDLYAGILDMRQLVKFGHLNYIETDMNDYPEWLQGQIAHYKVLDKKEYKELLEILK